MAFGIKTGSLSEVERKLRVENTIEKTMKDIQQKIYNSEHLNLAESQRIFEALVKGKLSEIEMTSLLVSLKIKGEQPAEIAGAAEALRQHAQHFPKPDYPVADSCGTGGSGMNTVNISTMVAITLAELGLPMVKHGNRSVSSKCGSADVLERLGFKIDLNPEQARMCLDELNFCFLFAPNYHLGVKHVMPVRNQLQTRTIFNLLGPLINPANPEFQLMGVYSPELCLPAAETLKLAGCQSAMLVHSAGYDEITLHSDTKVVELKNGEIKSYTISNNDFALPSCFKEDITGNDPELNAEIFVDILTGNLDSKKKLAIANTVAANAAALLKLSNRVGTLKEGAEQALNLIKSGKTINRLNQLVALSQSFENNHSPAAESNSADLETSNV
jgi:anthranilate phosphoribosyltransferase